MPYKLKSKRKAYLREYHKNHYKRNKEQIDKKNTRWVREHPIDAKKHRRKSYMKCRVRRILAVRRWEKNNPEKVAEFKLRYASRRKIVSRKHLLRRYSLTIDTYALLLAHQDGKCAICRITIEEYLRQYQRGFDVDHSHKTGKVRGLLCMKCNGGLGLFVDNPVSLQRAIKYLK